VGPAAVSQGLRGVRSPNFADALALAFAAADVEYTFEHDTRGSFLDRMTAALGPLPPGVLGTDDEDDEGRSRGRDRGPPRHWTEQQF
jgi:hypothetical protein